ncbi:MAG: hypothetical protein AAFQ60_15060 [Pseudomonadota bacterium]
MTHNDFSALIFLPYQANCVHYIESCSTHDAVRLGLKPGETRDKMMPSYNKKFELSVEDIDLIEAALRAKKHDLSEQAHEKTCAERETVLICHETAEKVRSIHDLLGRIHNQKVFYRPQRQTYVSG